MADDMASWCSDPGQESNRLTYNYTRMGVVCIVSERLRKVNGRCSGRRSQDTEKQTEREPVAFTCEVGSYWIMEEIA